MYERGMCKTFNQWTLSNNCCYIAWHRKLNDRFIFFISLVRTNHSFVWIERKSTHHIGYTLVIQVCPHVDTKHNTSLLYRCEFAMCSWHLLLLLCWLSLRCVWHTRRKIAQTHNRKSRKKTPPITGIFYALCIIVSTSSNTNNTIAILESCEKKKEKQKWQKCYLM